MLQVTDLFETTAPPTEGTATVSFAEGTDRFSITIGVPNSSMNGSIPVTVSDCSCTSTTTTTTTATTTTTTLLDTGLDHSWQTGLCLRDSGGAVAPMYGHTSKITDNCTEEGAVHVSTQAECATACYQLGATTAKKYRSGSWGDSPGCFILTTSYKGNCHWNTNANVRSRYWSSVGEGACRIKVTLHMNPARLNSSRRLQSRLISVAQ